MTATPASVATAPLVFSVTQEVRVTTKVDLVGFFASLNVVEQSVYADTNLHEFGLTEEWQRPLAYLYNCLDVDVEAPSVGGFAASDVSVDAILDDRVTRRPGSDCVRFGAREFSTGDYATLVASVPWLAEREDALAFERTLSDATDPSIEAEKRAAAAAELARVPGPRDVPLFEESAAAQEGSR